MAISTKFRPVFFHSILMVLAFSVSSAVVSAQTVTPLDEYIAIHGKSIVQLKQEIPASTTVDRFLPVMISDNRSNQNAFSFQTASRKAPLIYSYEDLAFFCKLEVQMEKKAKLPIKVRLGDVEYVDRLEGKY